MFDPRPTPWTPALPAARGTLHDDTHEPAARELQRPPPGHEPAAPRWPARRIVTGHLPTPALRRAALAAGLLARPARIAPKFFYDAQGCALYGAICELTEYYPTRTEQAVFERHREAIARRLPRGAQWVDLGCGDGVKSAAWLRAVQARRYVAVDVSATWLERAMDAAASARPGIDCVGVMTDFEERLDLNAVLGETPEAPVVLFYPGSSIGNFEGAAARALLRDFARHAAGAGALLIGVDLVKDRALLEAAYDDALGVTAAFNRNVLRVVNRELDADFHPRAFVHQAHYDAALQRIEMRLVSRSAQEVRMAGTVRAFDAGEAIVTEYSHKYTVDGFAASLHEAGFRQVRHWTDPQGWFAVFLASEANA